MSLVNKQTFKLNTGATIPAVGLGTWQSAPGEVKNAVEWALKAGYRHMYVAVVWFCAFDVRLADLCALAMLRRFTTTKLRSVLVLRPRVCPVRRSS